MTLLAFKLAWRKHKRALLLILQDPSAKWGVLLRKRDLTKLTSFLEDLDFCDSSLAS
jgi:hypothetical protein